MNCSTIAYNVWRRYTNLSFPMSYTAIFTLYGALRLADVMNDDALRADVVKRLMPMLKGEVEKAAGYYGEYVYRWGGNAAAWALLGGHLPEGSAEVICAACDGLIRYQPRLENGIFCQKTWYDRTKLGLRWIDSVFGVCPFLLWTGLKCGRKDFIDEAAAQMRYHHELLFDHERKLYHQAIDGKQPEMTSGYWSRGMGWGLHALADLAADLPKDHPERDYILTAYRDAIDGCLSTQDPTGMWHQSMEDRGTYLESSGTALIVYALGKGIRTGFFTEEKYLAGFRRGLKGLMGYVCVDGSVMNCCGGCLGPGCNGTPADYQLRSWLPNDTHAFGGPLLACTEAVELQKKGIAVDGE